MNIRKWLFCAAMIGAALVTTVREVDAQSRADSAAVLLHAAEQLRLRGENGAARALLDLIARQYVGTPAAEQVQSMRALLRRAPDVERSGRTELLVSGAAYGAWLGIAFPLMFESDDAPAFGVGLLVGAPTGFFAAKSYADAYNPTEGQARALTFGATWGTAQGFMLVHALDIGTEEFCDQFGGCFETSDPEPAVLFGAGILGGLAGIATGAAIARKPITAGTAAAVTLSGLWGTWFGWGIGFVGGAEDDALFATTMIGGNAALLLGGLMAPSWAMSESRARLISVGGLIGGLGGLGLLLIAESGEDESFIVLVATSALGLGLGAYWTRAQDRPADGGMEGNGALLNLRDGKWSLDTPLPALRMERSPTRGRNAAAYVPLLRARF